MLSWLYCIWASLSVKFTSMKVIKNLWRYLKPFWWILLLILGLTFTQVQLDLALPDYMSHIVTYGIQYGGIEDSALEVVRKSTLDDMMLFMSEGDKETVLASYTLYEEGTQGVVDDQLIEFKEDVYLLNEDYDEELASIEERPLVYTYSLYASGVSDIDALVSEDMIASLEEEINTSMGIDDSGLETMAIMYVGDEYEAVGMAMDTLQTNYILHTGMVMLGIAALCGLTQVVSTYMATRLAARVAANVRHDVFKKVQSLATSDMDKFSLSSLITRTTNDVTQLQQLVQMMCRIILIAPMMGIVSITKVLRYPDLIWILGVALACIIAVMIIALIVAMPRFAKIQGLVDRLNRVMREFLDGMLVIRAFNSQKAEEKRFDEANDEYRRTDLFVSRAMSLIMPFLMFIMNMTTVLVVWFGSKQVDFNAISVGEIMAFIQYAMQVLMSFMIVAMIWVMIPRALVSVRRIFEVLDTKDAILDPDVPKEMPKRTGVLAFEDVSFAYPGADEPVLEHITFDIKPNETVAFIGSTGSGKSTIVKLILRLFDVTKGRITYNGTDIRDFRQKDIREHIGYVPQKAVLFSGTIRSNIEFGRHIDDKTLNNAIDVSQSREIVEENALGLDAEIVQGGTNVSGGQRQRLSIARALAKDSNIYIFDDSFSALDYATDKKLRKALDVMTSAKKATVIIVAQRISTIRDADKIVVLDEGKIAGIGTHSELLASCQVYKEIALSQLSAEELANA